MSGQSALDAICGELSDAFSKHPLSPPTEILLLWERFYTHLPSGESEHDIRRSHFAWSRILDLQLINRTIDMDPDVSQLTDSSPRSIQELIYCPHAPVQGHTCVHAIASLARILTLAIKDIQQSWNLISRTINMIPEIFTRWWQRFWFKMAMWIHDGTFNLAEPLSSLICLSCRVPFRGQEYEFYEYVIMVSPPLSHLS